MCIKRVSYAPWCRTHNQQTLLPRDAHLANCSCKTQWQFAVLLTICTWASNYHNLCYHTGSSTPAKIVYIFKTTLKSMSFDRVWERLMDCWNIFNNMPCGLWTEEVEDLFLYKLMAWLRSSLPRAQEKRTVCWERASQFACRRENPKDLLS